MRVLNVAFDEDLADRLRELLADEQDIHEKRMFGGLAFLISGNMAVTVSSQGGLLLRVDPERTDDLVKRPHAQRFVMRGRAMDGWLHIDTDGIRTKRDLKRWVRLGMARARSLPAKR